MNKLKLELAIPLVIHERMIGILTLGKKKSDEEYTQDDMDILLPLARTLSIAISNAEMFDFRRISVVSEGVSAILVTRRLEIEAPILVLLMVLRAGAPTMTLNGKFQFKCFDIGLVGICYCGIIGSVA